MKTESASVDHFAGLQEIADTITRLREDNAVMLDALKAIIAMYGPSKEYGHKARVAWEDVEAAIAQAERAR